MYVEYWVVKLTKLFTRLTTKNPSSASVFKSTSLLVNGQKKKRKEKQNAYLRLFDEGLPQWLSQMTSATISKGKLNYWLHTATNFVWKIP